MKSILVLNGSPRRAGNTSALVREFTNGAQQSGHTVTSIFLHELEIKGCKGCWGGGKKPDSPCTIKDGMETIYPLYRQADIVVLASPLYYWSISGQLKTAFDRLFAVAECDPEYRNLQKDAVLLMAGEGDGFEESVYWCERVMGHIGWRDLGQVLASGVHGPGDIEGNPVLQKAYALGKSLH